MLKTIVKPSPELAGCVDSLNPPLPPPQRRHASQVADALITPQNR